MTAQADQDPNQDQDQHHFGAWISIRIGTDVVSKDGFRC
jgi:hypothetical protein